MAFFRRRQHGQRVRPGLGGDGRAFKRIECDIDLRPLAGGAADLFADIEHRRLVALAFTDDDGTVHVEFVESLAHRFDRRVIRGFLVTAADQFGGGDCGSFGYAHHFQYKNTIEYIVGGLGFLSFSHRSPHRRSVLVA